MAITIVPEDGSGVAGANSYAVPQQLIDYAAQRGVTLADDDSTAVLLIKACDYIESKNYAGLPTHDDQPLKWPRIIGCNTADDPQSNSIPWNIVKAQIVAALLVNDGEDLMPIGDGNIMTKQKVGPIETDWSPNPKSNGPIFPQLDSLLEPYVQGNNLFGGFANLSISRG